MSAKTNAIKYRDGLDKMKVNEPETWKLGQGRNSWEWSKDALLYPEVLLALKREKNCQFWNLNREERNLCVRISSLRKPDGVN